MRRYLVFILTGWRDRDRTLFFMWLANIVVLLSWATFIIGFLVQHFHQVK